MKQATIIGLGWLGMPLAQHLICQGWQIKGTKRQAVPGEIACYPFDLNEFTPHSLTPLWGSKHLIITLPPSTCTADIYVSGIKRLVSNGIEQGISHVIFLSSTSLLPRRSGQFDEQSPIEATNAPALADIEQWLFTLPIQCDILRLAGLVGKQRHPVFHLAGKQALTGGNQPVNLVHLDDAILAIENLLNQPNGQRIFHLCAPHHPSRQAFYTDMARRFMLPDLQFLPDPEPLDRLILASLIERKLGFRYRYPNPYFFRMEK